MIRNLMYKQFRLNINPGFLLLLTLVGLLFIPKWVFFIALSYIFFLFMVQGQMDKVNQDLTFACSLPVSKSSIVTAQTITIMIIEAANLMIAAVAAVASYWLYHADNQAGMNTNLAFFGLMLMMYAIFNLIYLPGSYTKAYRMLVPMLGGALTAVMVGGALTSVVAFQPDVARILNDRGLGHSGAQIAVFIAGLVVYAGLTLIAHHKAVDNFAKIDL